MLILFVAMLAVGIYEAWSNKRGALGWIVSTSPRSLAASWPLISVAYMDMILPHLDLEGSLASSQHPLAYVFIAAMAILTVFGSWITLQIVKPIPMNSSATALLRLPCPHRGGCSLNGRAD